MTKREIEAVRAKREAELRDAQRAVREKNRNWESIIKEVMQVEHLAETRIGWKR